MDGSYDLDTMMGYLGDFGKYQAWQFTLHILSAVTAGLNMLSLVTVAAVPDHRCEIPGIDLNGTFTPLNDSMKEIFIPRLASGKFDSCSLFNITTNSTYKCDSWVFDHQYYGTSRAIEWKFICDQRWMGAVAQSMYMFGVFTGAVVLGNLADKVGRKPIFCWSAVLQLVLGVGVAFTPEYYSFLFIRYLYGIFGSAGSYIPGFVLTMELVGASKRSMCGVAFQAAFAMGFMLVAGWGSFIKDRQILQIIYGCHAIVLVGHFWLMDESPRWLWGQGRIKEAVDIVKKALKMNGSPINLETAEFVSKGKSETRTSGESAGVLDLFRTPNLRKKTLNVMLCWFANSLVYYGLSLSTGSLEGNPYVTLFLMGLVELPSYVVTVYLMDRLGRRSLTAFEMIAGGICCIIAANLAMGSITSTSFVFIGKFLIAGSFAIIYNYSAELFPTVIRNSAMGLGAMCARTSGALTPLITLLDSFDPKMPAIIFAVIALISGFFVMFLPETLHKSMPQTVQDGEEFGIGDTCFSAMCGKTKLDEDEKEKPVLKKPQSELQPLK
ncbi:organic cation transporter protein [Anoplophora glabripennis]|nr:organic cation transporter protein [Anoplophora glabripennis]